MERAFTVVAPRAVSHSPECACGDGWNLSPISLTRVTFAARCGHGAGGEWRRKQRKQTKEEKPKQRCASIWLGECGPSRRPSAPFLIAAPIRAARRYPDAAAGSSVCAAGEQHQKGNECNCFSFWQFEVSDSVADAPRCTFPHAAVPSGRPAARRLRCSADVTRTSDSCCSLACVPLCLCRCDSGASAFPTRERPHQAICVLTTAAHRSQSPPSPAADRDDGGPARKRSPNGGDGVAIRAAAAVAGDGSAVRSSKHRRCLCAHRQCSSWKRSSSSHRCSLSPAAVSSAGVPARISAIIALASSVVCSHLRPRRQHGRTRGE